MGGSTQRNPAPVPSDPISRPPLSIHLSAQIPLIYVIFYCLAVGGRGREYWTYRHTPYIFNYSSFIPAPLEGDGYNAHPIIYWPSQLLVRSPVSGIWALSKPRAICHLLL